MNVKELDDITKNDYLCKSMEKQIDKKILAAHIKGKNKCEMSLSDFKENTNSDIDDELEERLPKIVNMYRKNGFGAKISYGYENSIIIYWGILPKIRCLFD